MNKRILSGLGLVCLALLVAASAAPLARAQAKQDSLYVYVSNWALPRAQWDEFSKAVEARRPIFERLVVNGTLVSWGAGAAIVHTADGFTHGNWFYANSLENILKANEELSKTALGLPFTSATKHADLLLRVIAGNGKTAAVSSGFLTVAGWPVKAGRDQEFEELFRKYFQPWLDQMVAEGSALRYNLNSEVVHTQAPGFYELAVVLRDAASYDKFHANVRAMLQNPAVPGAIRDAAAVEGHRDILARVIAYQHK